MSKARILLALLLLSGWAYADADATKTVTSQCVATFIYEGIREDVVLWNSMFHLDNDEILHYLKLLKQLEAEGELPDELIEKAIVACRKLFREVQALDDPASQASAVEGLE